VGETEGRRDLKRRRDEAMYWLGEKERRGERANGRNGEWKKRRIGEEVRGRNGEREKGRRGGMFYKSLILFAEIGVIRG
jgi:hypothetical protein